MRELYKNIKETLAVKSDESKNKELEELNKKKLGICLNLLKTVGDMLPSGIAGDVIPKIIKNKLSEPMVAAGGLVSSLISVYQIWNDT